MSKGQQCRRVTVAAQSQAAEEERFWHGVHPETVVEGAFSGANSELHHVDSRISATRVAKLAVIGFDWGSVMTADEKWDVV